jgi:hypothetical protein
MQVLHLNRTINQQETVDHIVQHGANEQDATDLIGRITRSTGADRQQDASAAAFIRTVEIYMRDGQLISLSSLPPPPERMSS